MTSSTSLLGYKQKPGSKVWEEIPVLTLDRVVKEVNPQKAGYVDGNDNKPPAQSRKPAETEQRIIHVAEDYLKRVDDFANKEFTDITRQVETLKLDGIEDDFSDLKRSAEQGLNEYNLDALPRLVKLRKAERTALRDLNRFKAENGLQRQALYSESRVKHFGWISVMLFVECAINMGFFAEGTDLGLGGGFFYALLVSAVNISLCVLFGWLCFRELHHSRWVRKLLGGCGVVLWGLFLLLYNLAVAHFRDLLVLDPDHAKVLVLEKMRAGLFGLETQESLLVLGIGLAIGIIATIKGYTVDDPYPGYGRQDRAYREHEAAYENEETALRKRMATGLSAVEQTVDERLQDYEKRAAKLIDLYNGSASVVAHFDNIYQQVDEIIKAAVTIYREANMRVRTEAAPESFSSMPVVERLLEKHRWVAWLEDLRRMKEQTEAVLKEMRRAARAVKEEVAAAMGRMSERVDNLASEVDERAGRQLERNRMEV